MTENEIYRLAIKKFGEQGQYDMLIEEMAELTQAILKFRRNPSAIGNLHEEFADVSIVMAQIELLLDKSTLEDIKWVKLNRLAERIKNHA